MSSVTVSNRTLRIPHVFRQSVPDSRSSNRKSPTAARAEPVAWDGVWRLDDCRLSSRKCAINSAFSVLGLHLTVYINVVGCRRCQLLHQIQCFCQLYNSSLSCKQTLQVIAVTHTPLQDSSTNCYICFKQLKDNELMSVLDPRSFSKPGTWIICNNGTWYVCSVTRFGYL